jgi:hypothetical protein
VQGRWPLGLPGRATYPGTPNSPVCDAPESHSRPVVPGPRCPSCHPTLDRRRFQGRRVAGGLGSGMHRGFETVHLVDDPGADGMRLALGVCAALRQRRFGDSLVGGFEPGLVGRGAGRRRRRRASKDPAMREARHFRYVPLHAACAGCSDFHAHARRFYLPRRLLACCLSGRSRGRGARSPRPFHAGPLRRSDGVAHRTIRSICSGC